MNIFFRFTNTKESSLVSCGLVFGAPVVLTRKNIPGRRIRVDRNGNGSTSWKNRNPRRHFLPTVMTPIRIPGIFVFLRGYKDWRQGQVMIGGFRRIAAMASAAIRTPVDSRIFCLNRSRMYQRRVAGRSHRCKCDEGDGFHR